MKQFAFNFFFPNQVGPRQEVTIHEEGSNVGVAFKRAWNILRSSSKYRGRKGLDTFRVGITMVREVHHVQSEAGTGQET